MAVLKYLLRNKAFSLLELIIAIAILSIGIVAVLQAFSFSSRSTGLFCDFLDAVFLAEDKIQDLELKERQKLLKEEEIRGSKDKFNYSYNITQDPVSKLYKVNFDITWERLSRKETINVSTYLKQ